MPIVTAPTATLDQENFFSATLAQNLGASDLTIYLNQVPTTVTEGYLTISRKSSSLREVIYFTSVDSVLKTVTCPATGGRGVAGTAQAHTAGETIAMTNNAEYWQAHKQGYGFLDGVINHRQNILDNGNFINASINGYGGVPEDWTNSSLANVIQGGFPALTKQGLIDLLGITTGNIEGLWTLNGNFTDLSDNTYSLSASGAPADAFSCPMAQCKDFESGSSQYASIADGSCPDLEISGSMTVFGLVKPESVGATQIIASKFKNSVAGGYSLGLYFDGTYLVPSFTCRGHATNTSVTGDVVVEAGKWYMVVGVYDSANNLLKVWINGIKKQVTSSGSTTDSNAIFAIGADHNGGADAAANFFDGMIQAVGVLSTALSDDQVKRLWSYFTYKGVKCGRSGSDGYIYQSLPQDLVERLRGKKLTLRAAMYQDVASIGQISIYDGSETANSTDTTVNSWLEKSVTKTISSTATEITVRLKVSTSNGNVWFKEVALYQGAILLPWQASLTDWARYPGLMRLDPAGVINGYSFEENRWYDNWTPVWTNLTVGNGTVNKGYRHSGKMMDFFYNLTLGGTTSVGTDPRFNAPGIYHSDYTSTTFMSIGNANFQDTGTANHPGFLWKNNSADQITIPIALRVDATWATSGGLQAAVPFAWASGDVMRMQGRFKLA